MADPYEIPQPRTKDDLNAAAGDLNVRIKDLLVLSPEVDPFNAGTVAKRRDAEWFADLWSRFGFQNGGVHVRRVHYRAQATGDVLLPSGEVYRNTHEHWQIIQPASNHARDLGLVDPSLFVDRRNQALSRYARVRDWPAEPQWEADLPEDMPWTAPTIGEWPAPHVDILGMSRLAVADGGVDSQDIGDVTVSGYGYDPGDQPFYEVLWIEKSTMDDVLDPLCRRLGIDYSAGKGFASKTRPIEALRLARAAGKPLRVFTISDYDPAGSHMAAAISRHIEFYRDVIAPGTEVVVRHIGMSAEWVSKYGLPRVPIEAGKSASAQGRIDSFEAIHGDGAVELDALEALHPGALSAELATLIASYRDADLGDRLADVEDSAQQHASDAWHASTESVRTRVDHISTEISQLSGRYRDRLADLERRRGETLKPYRLKLQQVAAEVRAALEPLKVEHEGIADEFEAETGTYHRQLEDLWREARGLAEDAPIDLPERPEPEVDPDEDGVLFDSRRHWWDQLQRYRAERKLDPLDHNVGYVGKPATCEVCGTVFQRKRTDKIVCSRKCYDVGRRARLAQGGG